MIKIIKTKDYAEMSKMTAEIIIKDITKKHDLIIGLATGGTPEGLYKNIVEDFKQNKTDWSKVKSFNLDEYIGIPEDHPLSYHTYMNEMLFKHININPDNINIPNGNGNVTKSGPEYDQLIENSGGIDLQILGIGENAHIAFNEPGSKQNDGTRKVELTESTINANSRYFVPKDEVPKTAITMGIGTILKAKKIILLASGVKKAQAILKTVKGEVTVDVPSSFLQLHSDVTIILDEEAASLIN